MSIVIATTGKHSRFAFRVSRKLRFHVREADTRKLRETEEIASFRLRDLRNDIV